MKICLKCKQQYPNGFQYCPNDTERLVSEEEYVRQTRPISAVPAAAEVAQRVVEPVPSTNPFPETERAPRPNGSAPGGEMPFRRTEPIRADRQPEPARPATNGQPHNGFTRTERPAPVAPTEPIQPQRPTAPQMPAPQPTAAARPTQVSAPASFNAAPAEAGGFSFTVPQQPGLIANLIAGLKNIGEAFKSGPQVKAAGAGDFQFLLVEESLPTRIARELGNAGREFKQNPKQFAIDFVRGEGSNRFRRNALLAGSELALVGYVTLYFIGIAIGVIGKTSGWRLNLIGVGLAIYLAACFLTRGFLLYKLINRVSGKLAVPKFALEIANWAPVIALFLFLGLKMNYGLYCLIFPTKCVVPEEKKEEVLENIAMIAKEEMKVETKKADVPKKQIGGSLSKPKPASGGGGGGRNQPTPPSKGVPPQMALTPQIVMPNPEPPKIKNPTLVVAQTIYGDPNIKMPKGPIGDPTGVPAPPSSGPGEGAGIGRGKGTGVGGGEGGGAGPGRGGNTGGGNMGLGGGGSVEPMSATLKPTILFKEKAKYTEEARQNKVQGSVILSVVFGADGQITNIRVVRGLPDGLTEKAIEAAKRIRFQPAVKNGTPVSVRGSLDFTFNLY